MKLAIIITHPIQYYSPVFKMLSDTNWLKLRVFFTRGNEVKVYDHGFRKEISWDIPILEGYDYVFLENTAKDPGSHHFWGIINPRLVNEIESWGAESVLIYGWSFYSHLKAMRYFKDKIPVYFRGDSHILDDKPRLNSVLKRIFLYWVYRHIDTAFYVGTNNKEYFVWHGLKKSQLVFAPHAIDNARFADPGGRYEADVARWRKELKIKPDQKVILFCGKFENKKDPFLLLQVAEEFSYKKDVVFLFVGNGHLEKRMKDKAAIMNNVRFLSFQNQSRMPVVYRLGDIFVLPSKGPGETWGLAVNEAMACQRSVIVSDKVGCAKDLIIDGANGHIFINQSVESLSNKLLSMLTKDLKEAGEMSAEIIQEWSFEQQIRGFFSIIKPSRKENKSISG